MSSRSRSQLSQPPRMDLSMRSRSHSSLRQKCLNSALELPRSASGSRSSSPTAPSRRIAKLNMYLAKSVASSTPDLHQPEESAADPPQALEIKRWDGNCRTTMKWDSIRKDSELWYASGDCYVYFYERGSSKRGASLKIPLKDLKKNQCGPLLHHHYSDAINQAAHSPQPSNAAEPSDYFHNPYPPAEHGLYMPAPAGLSREEAYQYHLTTRNFFAWLNKKPIVGECLGPALISLLERMNEYRLNVQDNQVSMLLYMDDQGYTDFRDCPDHALAVLQYAEVFQHRELWTDAFVHCVGMSEQLETSPEYEYVSRATKALITRANLEMDLRLERAGELLGNFLEDDLSGANLGLGKEAHQHLERFRSFLHSYYVGHHCYWPPPSPIEDSVSFPQSVYRSMYYDFRNLYSYLVDRSSGLSIQDNKPVDGGICVFQNIQAFDKRNKYAALPHPLPLVPKMPASLASRKGLGRLFASKKVNFDRRAAASSALASASNTSDFETTESALVQEYMHFEKLWTMREGEAVSCADARKVRWILVYAILQTLVSVTQIPKDVRDTEGVQYPLCCQIAGTPPWEVGKPIGSRQSQQVSAPRPKSLRDQIIEMGPDMDIVNAKPSPLSIPSKPLKTPSPSRGSSISRLTLRTPKPIATRRSEILTSESNVSLSLIPEDVSPVNGNASVSSLSEPPSPLDPLPTFSLPTISPGPMQHTSTFTMPIPTHPKTPEPSTPSTSESGVNSNSGWSSNASSEDDMDHASVVSNSSHYSGEDESDAKSRQLHKRALARRHKLRQERLQQSPSVPTKSALRPQSFHEDLSQDDANASTTSLFTPERASNPEIEAYLVS